MITDFEEKYFDVLQNMEFAIVNVYRQERDLNDYDVDKVLGALILAYKSRQQNRDFVQPALKPLAQQLYDDVEQMCEWRLGREQLVEDDLEPHEPSIAPLSVDEVLACLKRIRKSVETWNKRGGVQGYLQYVDQFIA